MLSSIVFHIKHPLNLLIRLIVLLPYFSFIRETRDYQCPITFQMWFKQKVLKHGRNYRAYWPMHPTSTITGPNNIYVGVDTNPGYMKGCYIQGIGLIYIGDYTQIAPNVSIISANHELYDTRNHLPSKVIIGSYSWLGVGSTILPGVELGEFTIVGAGSVVTKSFPEGHCVIAGNPAKLIKEIEKDKCVRFENRVKYNGYIKSSKFETSLGKRIKAKFN